MDTETTVAGAEAGSDTSAASSEAGHIPANYDATGTTDAGNVEPGADSAAEGAVSDKAPLPPLTVEEYQKRHDNINVALRESRQRERTTRDEVAQLRSQMEQMRTTQPQAFERYTLEANLREYANIDWRAWEAQDPNGARAAWGEFQAAQQRKGQMDQQERTATEQAQQQQRQQQVNALVSTLGEQEAAIRQAKPDYDQAVAFLREEMTKDINAQGYFGEHAARMVMNEILGIGARVHAAGQDLAEFSYNAAVQRGYKAAANIQPMIEGEAAAKTISDLGAPGGQGGATFEEQMGNLSGAAARNFWAKEKARRGM